MELSKNEIGNDMTTILEKLKEFLEDNPLSLDEICNSFVREDIDWSSYIFKTDDFLIGFLCEYIAYCNIAG